MKKKLFLLFMTAFFQVAAVCAETVTMQRTNYDPALQSGQHKAPAILPTVDYTDGILTVQSTIPLSDVTVIIRDEEGTLLYTYFIYSVAGNYILSLPSSILNDMYSVELVYGSIHLIGYF